MNYNLPKSFSRRIGKSLSKLQKSLIEVELPKYQIPEKFSLDNIKYDKINIEIGIGMAEHFINQCSLHKNDFFLGFEPYMNGIANCLKLAKENNIENFMLWPDDAEMILPKIKKSTIDKFFVLFPDPWPKKRQKKRRFITSEKIKLIFDLLKNGGEFIFASDIDDYFDDVYEFALEQGFVCNSNINFSSHEGYIKTKYNEKAEKEGRNARFMIMRRI